MNEHTITLAGTIQKLIDRSTLRQPQHVQIGLQGAEPMYDELRIPNTLGWAAGTAVEVTIRMLPPLA